MEDLRQALKEHKLHFGFKQTLKLLQQHKLQKVFVASNCPTSLRETLKRYPVHIIELKEPSNEVALLCKKSFAMTVLSY